MHKPINHAIVLLLFCGVTSTANAQLDFLEVIGLKKMEAIGIGGGVVSVSEEVGTTFNVGGRAVFSTPVKKLYLTEALRIWTKTESDEEDFFGSPMKFETTLIDLALETDGQYHLSSETSKMSPFVQAGIGINYILSEAKVTLLGTTTTDTDAESKIGVNLGGGVELKVSDSLKGYVDVKYIIVKDLNQFNIQVGILF